MNTNKMYSPYVPLKPEPKRIDIVVMPTRIEVRLLEIIAQFMFVTVFVYVTGLFLDPYLFPEYPTTILSSLFGASIGIWVSSGFRNNVKHVWRWVFHRKQSKPETTLDKIHDANADLNALLMAATKKVEEMKPLSEKQQIDKLKGNLLDE